MGYGLLIIDKAPIHSNSKLKSLFRKERKPLCYIPAGYTFILQPLHIIILL